MPKKPKTWLRRDLAITPLQVVEFDDKDTGMFVIDGATGRVSGVPCVRKTGVFVFEDAQCNQTSVLEDAAVELLNSTVFREKPYTPAEKGRIEAQWKDIFKVGASHDKKF